MLNELLLALNLHVAEVRAADDPSRNPIEHNGHYLLGMAALTPDPRVASRFKERPLYAIPRDNGLRAFQRYSDRIEVRPVSRRHCRFYSRRGD